MATFKMKFLASVVVFTFTINTLAFAGGDPSLLRSITPHQEQASGLNAIDILNTQSSLRAELVRKLDSGEFSAELQGMGVKKEEAQTRLAAMTDSELQQVISGSQREAGGEVVVISVTALLVIVLLLILLLRPGHGSSHPVIVT